MGAVADVVFVLDADDVDDLARLLDLRNLNLAESDMENLALLLQLFSGAEGLFKRSLGVDAVKLPERKSLKAEKTKAQLDLLNEVRRSAYRLPCIGTLTGEAALRGNDSSLLVGSEGFADEALADRRAVGIGGVNEIDAEFDGAAQDFVGVFRAFEFAPDTIANNAHGAESKTVDIEVAAQLEGFRMCAHEALDDDRMGKGARFCQHRPNWPNAEGARGEAPAAARDDF